MRLFDARRKQLEDLERETLSNPTPQNMVMLAERCMAAGDDGKALEVARKAVSRFPTSEKCQAVFQNVRRLQLQSEIQDLNRSLRENPTKLHFERLAEIYYGELGNRTKAFETAIEGLAKFPDSDGLHLVAGQIRRERFHQEFVGNDFIESARHFEKAAAANPQNYKAWLSLGRLYAEIGSYDRSKTALERALNLVPGESNVETLLQKVTALMGSGVQDLDEVVAVVESRRALSPEGEEIRRLFDPSARSVPAAASASVTADKIEAFLARYESLSGYKCSAVLARDGACIASHSRGPVETQLFAALLQTVYRCSEEAARKMDIGTFVDGEIETPIGRMAVAEWKGYIVGILADAPARKTDLDGAVERFVSFLSVG